MLMRLLKVLRPQEGWLVWSLSLLATLCLPLSLLTVKWVEGSDVLVGLAILAFLLSAAMARLRFPGWLGVPLLAVFGVVSVAGLVGRVLPRLSTVATEWWYTLMWLRRAPGVELNPLPFARLASDIGRQTLTLGRRLSWWGRSVVTGGAQQDNLVFLILVAALLWIVTAWAAWWLHGRGRVLVALLPTGVLLSTNAYFAARAEIWVLVFLGCLTALMIGLPYHLLEKRWTGAGISFSEDARLDLLGVGTALIIAVVGLSAALPAIASRRTAEWIWQYLSRPWARVEDSAELLFPDLEKPIQPRSGAPVRSTGGLPRSHLLGGNAELGSTIALRVSVDEPPPGEEGGEAHYWRSHSYAAYTGAGWELGDVSGLELGTGQPWSDEPLTGRRDLLQRVQVLGASDRMLYAAGEPLAPDRPYRALLRDERDLASLAPLRRARSYTIMSAVPAVAEERLRAAGEAYPDWVTPRYQSLPPLPQRVVDLASELVAGTDTSYDAAVALESYLRSFPYTLDVETPPEGRDVVDFFLFDLQKGYCDYYATSMTVMARSVGLPARMAVGYASGDYSAEQGVFEVLEKHAHSWVEIYFPIYGWIPFEPTASRATLERRGAIEAETSLGIDAGLDALRQRALADQLRASLWRRILWVGLTIAGLAAAAVVWRRTRGRWEAGLPAPQAAYFGMARWGELLGRRAAGHETPLEYGRALGDHLQSLAPSIRPARTTTEADEIHARDLWRRLRRKLWTFRVTQPLRRKKG